MSPHTHQQVTLFRANTNNSANAGTFALNLNNRSGNANQNIGRHVCLLHFC